MKDLLDLVAHMMKLTTNKNMQRNIFKKVKTREIVKMLLIRLTLKETEDP